MIKIYKYNNITTTKYDKNIFSYFLMLIIMVKINKLIKKQTIKKSLFKFNNKLRTISTYPNKIYIFPIIKI